MIYDTWYDGSNSWNECEGSSGIEKFFFLGIERTRAYLFINID